MALEMDAVNFLPTETRVSFPTSGAIFDAHDPRINDLSREERVRQYYARELAAGNIDLLSPRYQASEDDNLANNPYADTLVADPLNDPQIGTIVSMLKATGFKPEPEDELTD